MFCLTGMRSRFKKKIELVLNIVFDSCLQRLQENCVRNNDNTSKHSQTLKPKQVSLSVSLEKKRTRWFLDDHLETWCCRRFRLAYQQVVESSRGHQLHLRMPRTEKPSY